jgi:hypothetical protein
LISNRRKTNLNSLQAGVSALDVLLETSSMFCAMRKWLRRFVKSGIWLLSVLVLFLIEEHIRGRILLSTYKRQLRITGEKLTLSELGLTNALTPPDKATSDLLEAAKTLGDWNPRDSWEANTQNKLRFMRISTPGAATFSWCEPSTNSQAGVPQNEWPAISQKLITNATALSEAMNELRRNPMPAPYGFRDRSTFARKQRESIRYWLMWASANNLREGNLDDAGECILALARLSKTFQPVHSGYYRHYAEIGLEATWELLQSGATNETQLSALQDIWSRGSIMPILAAQLETYRAFYLKEIESLDWPPDRNKSTSNFSWQHNQLTSPTQAVLWFLVARSFDEYGVFLISQNDLCRVRSGAKSRQWKDCQNSVPSLSSCLIWRWAMPYSWRESSRVYHGDYLQRFFEFETFREMTVTAIALQRFRLRQNKWPEKLEELVPSLMPTLPRDWMDGEPLRYRRNSDGTFTLYSIGLDFKDDGGSVKPASAGGMCNCPPPIWHAQDTVWPCITGTKLDATLKHRN